MDLLDSNETETTFRAIGAEVGPVTFTMEPWQGEYLAEFIATHNPQIPYTFLVGCEEPRQVTYLAYGGEMWSADEGLTEFVVDKLFER